MSVIQTLYEPASSSECPVSLPARLSVHLFGPEQVQVDGTPVDVSRLQKPLTLLAYLAIENRPHARGTLAALFWPDAAQEKALRNLRQLLHRLRRAIRDAEAEPPHLLSAAQTLQFNAESNAWVDVAAFEALVNETQQHRHRRLSACPACIARLETAVAHYRGPFLDGLDVAGSGPFEEWVLIRREHLQQRACAALHAVAEYRLAHGQWEQAQRYARRLLRFDPWDEAAERLLLRALAMRKERNAALFEYQRFQQVLAAQLGVEPEDETLALIAKIRSGELFAAPRRSADEALPRPSTPLIGRETEQAQLHAHLAHRDRRLITVLGPGGSGKTRLALHAATEQAPDWRDGVRLVLLADVATAAQLEDALTAALPINATGPSSRLAHLLDYLREKELLLLLENFEHLLDGAPQLQEILHHAPRVKVLITSRARLNVPEEWSIQLDGLSCPDDSLTGPLAVQYSAVQLFAHHARRVNPGWSLQPENLPHVLRICQLVAGLPLGIELAAVWVRGFSCRQIADEIERNLDFLRQAQPHGPARQQSLRATFDYSYALLPEAERQLLRKLAVFHAGFEGEAAQRIAGADPSTLTALQDKSLLQTSSTGRRTLHPLLRRYAAERLAAHLDEERETQTRHGHFYTTFLQRQEARLVGKHPETALAAIGVEMGNVRAAWDWAVAQNSIENLGRGVGALSRFYELRGLFQQGEETFGNAAERVLTSDKLDAIEKPDRKAQSVAAQLLVEQAHFLVRRAMYQRAIQTTQKAIDLAQSAQDARSEAAGYLQWGLAFRHQGNYEEAHPLLERAVTLARTASSTSHPVELASWLEAESLRTLGAVSWKQSDYAGARAYLEQALQVDREIGDRRGEGWTHNNLGLVVENEGHYGKATGYYEQALSTSRGIGYRWGESIALGNLGYIHARVGDYARAREYYRQDLQICREIGDRRGENWTLGYLGLLSHQQGNDKDGLKYSQQALAISQEIGDRRRQAHDLTHLGHALTGLERLPEAAQIYRQALELRRELDDYPLVMETLAGLIRASLAQEDVTQAQARAGEILAYLVDHNVERTDESTRIYLACYRALRASGDPRARGILTAAHRQLQKRAAKIADETLRRSFLENVAVHREIVRLFESEGLTTRHLQHNLPESFDGATFTQN